MLFVNTVNHRTINLQNAKKSISVNITASDEAMKVGRSI
jgi:hypothetical protein